MHLLFDVRNVLLTLYGMEDWRIPADQANGTSSFAAFEEILELAATNLTSGFIVLKHDLFQQTVC
jgi:hypothetical protein